MCGIAGFSGRFDLVEDAAAVGLEMAARIRSRGPDASGVWTTDDGSVCLAHRRLSIIELSASGAQPMVSASGRYVVAFNGEIYNHRALREALPPDARPTWRGGSDTETLLACIEAWGLEDALPRLVGMFAIALWDTAEGALWLARDRLGEKPLYYAERPEGVAFASELSALGALPGLAPELDRDALALYLRYQYIPAPWSVFRGVRKLPPGTVMRVGEAPRPYWSFREMVANRRIRTDLSYEANTDRVEAALREALALQMQADVPLGAFLSGGIDSSLIVAMMAEISAQPVHTFAIGFEEPRFDEAPFARATAAHLGTDHHEMYVGEQDALAVVPELPRIYCEPFSDASQIPTFLVCRGARERVTVALSGDAGDELFAGYRRYQHGLATWRRLARLPGRDGAGRLLGAVPAASFDGILGPLLRRAPGRVRGLAPSDVIPRAAGMLQVDGPATLLREMISQWRRPADVVRGAREPRWLEQLEGPIGTDDIVEGMMAVDTVSYLPDDILVKVDRAAMAVSLETRVPFLDHRVVETAWSLPRAHKLRDGVGKAPLRTLLARRVPREMFERPKKGFSVPLAAWLRGALRDWAEALLCPRRLREDGVFDPDAVRRLWTAHLQGERAWHSQLWGILMFNAWWAAWRAGPNG